MTDSARGSFEAEFRRRTDEAYLKANSDLVQDHRVEHPWVTGALGDPYAPVWFVAENPSLTQIERVEKVTPESQWLQSPADKLFRCMLVANGFKKLPAEAPGGWRCYITDVIKSADRAGEYANIGADAQWKTAVAWAPVLRWELQQGKPQILVSVGKNADKFLTRLERENLVPALPTRICIPHYSFVAMRPDRQGRAAADPERVREYNARFAEIAQQDASRRNQARGPSRVARPFAHFAMGT